MLLTTFINQRVPKLAEHRIMFHLTEYNHSKQYIVFTPLVEVKIDREKAYPWMIIKFYTDLLESQKVHTLLLSELD